MLGSASIAVLMQSRLAATLPSGVGGGVPSSEAGTGPLPAFLHDGFATAMAQSMMLPAAVLVVGWVAVLCFETPRHLRTPGAERPAEARRTTRLAGLSGPAPAGRGSQAETLVPVLLRFSQASTTRAAMPASAALPQARGS